MYINFEQFIILNIINWTNCQKFYYTREKIFTLKLLVLPFVVCFCYIVYFVDFKPLSYIPLLKPLKFMEFIFWFNIDIIKHLKVLLVIQFQHKNQRDAVDLNFNQVWSNFQLLLLFDIS